MEQDNSHIKLGQRVKKHKIFPHKWSQIIVIPPDEACALVLTGSDSTTDQQANSYARDTKALIKDKKFPVYAAAYDKAGRNFRQDREAVLARHNQANPRYPYIRNVNEADKTYVPQYIRELYDATFAPRLRLKNGDKAPLALVAQRFNMMPVITHCQGSTALFQLEYLLLKDMTDLGYTNTQQDYLCRQIHSLNISPVTPIGITKTTAFKFMTLRDEVALSVNTPQTAYITDRQLHEDKPVMDVSMFRPTANEIIFVTDALYVENEDDPSLTSTTVEHSYAAYSDKEDDCRSISGDRMNMLFNLLLNRFVKHARQNQTELTELPDIFKERPFNFIFKKTMNNRYNFLKTEINRIRKHPETGTFFNKKER